MFLLSSSIFCLYRKTFQLLLVTLQVDRMNQFLIGSGYPHH